MSAQSASSSDDLLRPEPSKVTPDIGEALDLEFEQVIRTFTEIDDETNSTGRHVLGY